MHGGGTSTKTNACTAEIGRSTGHWALKGWLVGLAVSTSQHTGFTEEPVVGASSGQHSSAWPTLSSLCPDIKQVIRDTAGSAVPTRNSTNNIQTDAVERMGIDLAFITQQK